ncbi:putative sugar transporter [Mytilinidion resinicola]|uniref:Sugar transporter n=1 Tax=Mytilinidion resinicola TaxID=574789 RepID=A0A6A6YA29_9PEZI|nr:putative sugar transporter [Mytilinidion resinicola]KAF2805383.1 putative sugar transporter [Mytilinidion resinicola]
MPTLNPFKKHDVFEFPGVLIPMQQAHHRASITSNGSEKAESSDSTGDYDIHGLTLKSLRAEVEADLSTAGLNSAYDRKSKVINKAIQDIGMGRYQWELFVLCGFGWLTDNLWLQGVALTLPQLALEFGVSSSEIRYTTLALFLGLCLGASFWGIASDIIGRRLAFNTTLFLAGVFGLAAGGGPDWVGTAALFACLGLGVGGNLPVDGALFLEFLPFASGNLLTLLSVWWPVGQLIASLIAWGFIPNFSCPATTPSGDTTPTCAATGGAQPCCSRENNWGWRYFVLTLGALTVLMFICRFFFFHLFESPKFLLSRGRQAEAVAVVHGIAHHNKSQTWLTEQILNDIGGDPEVVTDMKLSTIDIVKRSLGKFSTQRIGPLFSSKRLGITTVLIWFQWTTIGMAYPLFNAFLPQYLANSGGDQPTATAIVYRNYAITSIVGVPGSIMACYTVDIKHIGRKGTMAIATVITGVFIFLFTVSSDPNFQLAFTCLEAFFQNIMYGVLYAYTPEVFPAPNRGTGTGISSFLNRIAGLCAPLVAINAGSSNPKAPIYASGGLFIAAFISMLLLPIETRGKQSL